MPRYIKAAAIILLGLLANCAVQQTKLDTSQLADIHRWNAKGKISISAEGERKSANFSWLNKGRDFDISLHGPFGSGAAKLKRRGNIVSYADGKENRRASSAEQLLYDATGWQLPISELAWWIKALPAPNTEFEQTSGDTGELSTLIQQGWQLQYKNYQLVRGHMLPGKIIAKRDEFKLLLVIKHWELKAR